MNIKYLIAILLKLLKLVATINTALGLKMYVFKIQIPELQVIVAWILNFVPQHPHLPCKIV